MSAIAWGPAETPSGGAASPRPHLVLVPGPVAALPAPALRLTARGRLVLVVLAAVLLAGVLGVQSVLGAEVAAPLSTVTVQPGQTLSEIAARELPALPVRDGVVAIQLANELSTVQVAAGQQLVIPQG